MKRLLGVLFLLVPLTVSAQWFWHNPLPQGNPLWSIHFVNENIGFSVGISGTILKTTNGGTDWILQSSNLSQNLWSVEFTTLTDGWIVGDWGIILKTSDGGNSWLEQESGTTAFSK